MKKATIAALMAVMALSLSACGQKKTAGDSAGSVPAAPKTLQAWLGGAEGVECVMQSPEGDIVIKQQDGKVRMEGIAYASADPAAGGAAEPGVSIYNGDWVYMWSGNKGTKLNQREAQATAEQLSAQVPETPENKDWQDLVDSYSAAAFPYDCQAKSFSDSEFDAPADVEFTDMGAMLSDMAEYSQQLEDMLNASGVTPDGEGEMMGVPELPDMSEYMEEVDPE